jgi:hypothetical protein
MKSVTCCFCGEEYGHDERISDYPKIPSGLSICPFCIEGGENGHVLCASCDMYFPESQGIDVEERIICIECKEANTIICSRCGQLAVDKRLINRRQIAGLCESCEAKHLYCDYIRGKNLEHAPAFKLTFRHLQNMKTVRLMGRLRHSYGDAPSNPDNKPFDVLAIHMSTLYRRRILDYGFSLVVVFDFPSHFCSLVEGSCTMTQFKKTWISHWHTMNTERSQESVLWSEGRMFHRWSRPYNLRAQTISDMDYRKEFNQGDLVYEGNNYGDTSNFYIVGSISKSKK